MEKIKKINVKLLNYEKELGDSRMELNINGDNINYVVMNSIRRTILTDIPIYAFNNFKFEKNTSIFNNTYLKLRLRNMPIWGIDNSVTFYDNKEVIKIDDTNTNTYSNMIIEEELLNETDTKVDTSSLKQFTMYVNQRNNNKSGEIYNVTTNDAKFYFAQKEIPSPYKNPIQLLKLQAGQEIAFSATTELGVESKDAIYSPVSVCYYNQKDTNDFNFIIESKGQLKEKRIIIVALDNLNKRLNNVLTMFKESMTTQENKEQHGVILNNKEQHGVILINNEDHTLGNLLSRGLQQHSNVSFAGYNLIHPLINKVELHYKMKGNYKIESALEEVIEYNIELFTNIKDIINKVLP